MTDFETWSHVKRRNMEDFPRKYYHALEFSPELISCSRILSKKYTQENGTFPDTQHSKYPPPWILRLWKNTHFCRIRKEGGSCPPPPPNRSFENRWRNIDILYNILKGILWRFRFNLNFSKIFWFRDFMSNFREITPQYRQNGCQKNFKLLKYEHIIYHFKARDLEIPLI